MIFSHVIIGGGILGLLLAKRLKEVFPQDEVVLFEKKNFVGEMASSRNSGVLHAGIYYPQKSLKREHCIRGNRLWRSISRDLSIPIMSCGKYIISTTSLEDERLSELFHLASENEVPGLRWANSDEIKNLLEYCHVSNAFFSSSTGVLDTSAAIKIIELTCSNLGVHILKNDEVFNIKKENDLFLIKSKKENIKTQRLYNCAGIEAVELRKKLGLENIEAYLVKGNYVRLKKRYYNDSLIYPIPPTDLKGLGIHTSFDHDGTVRFGPDTEDMESIDQITFEVKEQKVDEMFHGIQSIFKNITRSDLVPDYSGIRSKIIKDGNLFTDFIIGKEDFHGIKNYFELLGIESPGLTSAPSLVESLIF